MALKLNSRTKPVKIRIKSGGEEHASIQSLKNNFNVLDVCDLLDTRLSRWLRQQGQQELADELDILFPSNFERNDETIVVLLRLFFRQDFPSSNYNLLDFAKYWYTKRDMVNFMNLLYCSPMVAKYYYYNEKSILNENEWKLILMPYKFIDKEVCDILSLLETINKVDNNSNGSINTDKKNPIIEHYIKYGRNYDIDFLNKDEVDLVKFLNLCSNLKNSLSNWETCIWDHKTKIERLNKCGMPPKKYISLWWLLKESVSVFMKSNSIDSNIIKHFNNQYNSGIILDKLEFLQNEKSFWILNNSDDMKKFIDSIVVQSVNENNYGQ